MKRVLRSPARFGETETPRTSQSDRRCRFPPMGLAAALVFFTLDSASIAASQLDKFNRTGMSDPAEIERARSFFTTMPSEVFDLWIVPGIECHGWPFTSTSQSLEETQWKGFFGFQPLRFWTNARWGHVSIPASVRTFHPMTRTRIIAIIDTAHGVQTPMANVRDSAASYERADPCSESTRHNPRVVINR
jgi:hypothetical protein